VIKDREVNELVLSLYICTCFFCPTHLIWVEHEKRQVLMDKFNCFELFWMFLNLEEKKRKSIKFFYIFSGFSWIFLNLVDFIEGFWAVERRHIRKLLSQFCVSRHHPIFGLAYSLWWGFHLGLQPNLNPLLIVSLVDIVLSIRLLHSLPPTVLVLFTVHYTPFLQYTLVCSIHSQ